MATAETLEETATGEVLFCLVLYYIIHSEKFSHGTSGLVAAKNQQQV